MSCRGGNSLWGGLLYSVPFACWFFAVVEGAQAAEAVQATVADAFRILILVQAAAVVLLHPVLASGDVRRELPAVVALLAVPWPLLAVFFLAGGIGGTLLGVSQLVLLGAALVLLWMARLGRRVAGPALRPYAAPLVQISGLAAVIFTSGPWLAWAV